MIQAVAESVPQDRLCGLSMVVDDTLLASR